MPLHEALLLVAEQIQEPRSFTEACLAVGGFASRQAQDKVIASGRAAAMAIALLE